MIEQLIIENYKSIRYGKIALTPLNVLIGANGAGKSNFISFFELLQALLNQRLGSYVLTRGGIDALLYRGRKQSDFIRCLVDFNNTNAFFFELKPAAGNKAFIDYSGDYFNKSKDAFFLVNLFQRLRQVDCSLSHVFCYIPCLPRYCQMFSFSPYRKALISSLNLYFYRQRNHLPFSSFFYL